MRAGSKDLDIAGCDLMLTIPKEDRPTPERILLAQRRADIVTESVDNAASAPMFLNPAGKVVLPDHGEVLEQVLAVVEDLVDLVCVYGCGWWWQ